MRLLAENNIFNFLSIPTMFKGHRPRIIFFVIYSSSVYKLTYFKYVLKRNCSKIWLLLLLILLAIDEKIKLVDNLY